MKIAKQRIKIVSWFHMADVCTVQRTEPLKLSEALTNLKVAMLLLMEAPADLNAGGLQPLALMYTHISSFHGICWWIGWISLPEKLEYFILRAVGDIQLCALFNFYLMCQPSKVWARNKILGSTTYYFGNMAGTLF